MLKQVRHISEGNFYGLRVTNKAQKLSLEKEIRTLKACKDVQSHVYRKEEKELISTLKRLQVTKQDHFDHHENYEHPERLPSHHDRRPSFHTKQHPGDEHRPLQRPAERHDRKLHVKVKSEISDQRSSTKVPCQVNVCANASDVSVIISLSPITNSNNAAKQISGATLPPVSKPPKREFGTDIHRTEAFMSCVICNLPRYAHQGRESKNVCTCHVDPSKHPHHSQGHKDASKKRRKSHTDEEDLRKFAAKRERRRSLEVDDLPTRQALKQGITKSVAHEKHHGRSRASSFEEDNKGSHVPKGFDEYTAYVPGVGPHRRNIPENKFAPTDHGHDHGQRNRGNTLGYPRSRRASLDEGRSRWSSYTEGRSRESSLGEHDEPHYMRPLRGHVSRHNRTRQEEELHDLYNRLQKVFPLQDRRQYSGEEGDRQHRDAAANGRAEDQPPAFSGLQHPDNIINHHHFLPHEAINKQEKTRSTSHHAPAHPAGYHILGADRHGNKQDFYVTPGSTSHIAAAFDRNHDQDSGTHAMLMKLKQLLNVYHQMDNEAPRYPWPSPPTVKFTSEEFQKLRNCRYLRLTKSNIESLKQLEKQVHEQNGHKGETKLPEN
ncbi:uncharacterized protein LOC144658103 isoform X2 [Oculina patagonica]